MKRLAITLFALATMLVSLLSAIGHFDQEISASLDEQEITVTGHEELDPTLHIEAPSGTVLVHCPDCVLDKRQFGAEPDARPELATRFPSRPVVFEEPPSQSLDLVASGSPRAPPAA